MRPLEQLVRDRIQDDVLDGLLELFGVAYQSIEVIRLPERSAPLEMSVDLSRADTLPSFHERRDGLGRSKNHVHVIRHDAPDEELIAAAIIVKESVDDEGGGWRIELNAVCVERYELNSVLGIPMGKPLSTMDLDVAGLEFRRRR